MLDAIAKPFGLLLLWLYNLTGNYGVAICLFALVITLILLPFMMKSKRSSVKMSRLTPRVQELEKRHGANKQKYQEEVAKLYKEEHVNPASGCIWSLLPFPILLALYQAIRKPLTVMMGVPSSLLADGGSISNMLNQLGFSTTYNQSYAELAKCQFIAKNFDSFAPLSDKLQKVDFSFLGLDLGAQPNFKFFWSVDWSVTSSWLPALGLFLIPVIAAALTLLSSMVSLKTNPTPEGTDNSQANSMKTMMYLMPIMTLWFGFVMPAALGLYWIVTSVFGVLRDLWMTQHYKKIFALEDADFNARCAAKDREYASKHAATEELRAQNATTVNPNTSKKKQQVLTKAQQDAKAAEWEKKNRPARAAEDGEAPSQVGRRKYARGRAYNPDRFSDSDTPEESEPVKSAAPAEKAEPVEEPAESVDDTDILEPDEPETDNWDEPSDDNSDDSSDDHSND